ncbi:MAG: 4Fe-4S binding protein [Spirochaetes bacterium]|nr:4Fe-4S binding protein [Spirochaetota bacterium]
MKRKLITIDESLCNGCGECIPGCPEGAIQVIEGKARLVSDLLCDGLGACLGECPVHAITIEEREAEAYDEEKVMENLVRQGPKVIQAHLAHLKDHGEDAYHAQALAYLKKKEIPMSLESQPVHGAHAGCPGSRSAVFAPSAQPVSAGSPSALTHWPVQLHLVSPMAPQYRGADVLLAADCVAFAVGDFHGKWLAGKKLAIACPKLDDGQEIYLQKITAMVEEAKINTLTVMIMEVPCCRGLLQLAQEGIAKASRKIPLKAVVVSLEGELKSEEWV